MFLKDILSKPVINITNGMLEGIVINAVFDEGLRFVDKLVVFGACAGSSGSIRASEITLVTADSLVTETCAVTADEALPAVTIDAEVYTKGGKRIGKVTDIELNKFEVVSVLLDTGRAIKPGEIFCRGDIIILNEGSSKSDGGSIMNDEKMTSLEETLPKISRTKPRIAKEKAAGNAPVQSKTGQSKTGQSKPKQSKTGQKAQNTNLKPASNEAPDIEIKEETAGLQTGKTPVQESVCEGITQNEEIIKETQDIPQYTGTPIFEYVEEYAYATGIEETDKEREPVAEAQNTEFLQQNTDISYINISEFCSLQADPITANDLQDGKTIIDDVIEASSVETQKSESLPDNNEDNILPIEEEREEPVEETPTNTDIGESEPVISDIEQIEEPDRAKDDISDEQEQEEEVILPDPIAVGRSVYREIDKPRKRRPQTNPKWKFIDNEEGAQEDDFNFSENDGEFNGQRPEITVPDDFTAFMPATNMQADDEPIRLARITINTNTDKKERHVHDEADTAHMPDRILADFTFLLGRITTGPIRDSAGRVVIHKNELVTSDTVLLASKRGVLVQLTKYSLS